MKPRVTWLDAATMLGAIAPFVPYVQFFRDLSLVDFLVAAIPPDATVLLVPPAFLPVFILVWTWRRRSRVPTTPTWPAAARLFAIAAIVCSTVGTLTMQRLLVEFANLAWTAALLLPIAANLGLWWRNHRQRLPVDVTAEMLLLGTYVATTLPWTLVFLREGALIGAWLIAGVGVAYAAALVVRLRFRVRRLDDLVLAGDAPPRRSTRP